MRILLLIVAALMPLFVYRLWVIHATGMPLFFDEAYYLSWAGEPAFGYYSKPPLIAWSLALTSHLCGTGEMCLKSSSLAWYAAAALFTGLAGARLYGARTGIAGALVLYTMPAVALLSLAVSTDGPLLAFWALALWLFLLALDGRGWAWPALGIAIGFGLLSKYTMLLFPLSALLYLSTGSERHRLAAPGPWLALAIAFVVFFPNLWWNLNNGWPSLIHTAAIGSWAGERHHWRDLAGFVGAQFGVFGLLSFPIFVACCLRPALWHERRSRLLILLALPLLVLYGMQAWFGGANANWALAAYVPATLILTGELLRGGRRGRILLVVVLVLNIALGSVVYHWQTLAPMAGVTLARNTDPWARLLGWRELGGQLKQLRRPYPDAELLGDSRAVIAEMQYYAGPWPGVAAWNPDGSTTNHYELAADLGTRNARRYLYVGETAAQQFRAAFETVEPVGTIRARVYDDLLREYDVYLLTGFRGYPSRRQGEPES